MDFGGLYSDRTSRITFVSQITGIGQLLLELSLVVGWYTFLQHSEVGLCFIVTRFIVARPSPARVGVVTWSV